MPTKTNQIVISGSRERKILLDFTIKKRTALKGIVIFCHGYKGFKDWGPWNLVAQEFANHDYAFIKFNFSFNGGTIENPIDFPDLNAFSNNNYSTELHDLGKVIDWSINSELFDRELPIYIIGHSRGGGIALLRSNQDKRVSACATWASISSLEERFPFGKKMAAWQEEGVYYVENSRTNQQMPHSFQFYEDYIKNVDILDLRAHCKVMRVPVLVVHGDSDQAVHISNALKINRWIPSSKLQLMRDAGHTFGGKHPWNDDNLPNSLDSVVQSTIKFFNKKGLT